MVSLKNRKSLYVLGDVLACAVSLFAAKFLKYEFSWLFIDGAAEDFFVLFAAAVVCTLAALAVFGVYKIQSDRFGLADFGRMMASSAVIVVALVMLKNIVRALPGNVSDLVAVTEILIFGVFQLIICTAMRALPKYVYVSKARKIARTSELKRAIIVGAGSAGAIVARRLIENSKDGMIPVAFVDDDEMMKGIYIAGVPVKGTIAQLKDIARETGAQIVVITILGADSHIIGRIYEQCRELKLPVRLFANVSDVKEFKRGAGSLRSLTIEDLLFRDAIDVDMEPVEKFLGGKEVFVTGGAGSIGSELCRQILKYGCRHLVIFDVYENGLFDIGQELCAEFKGKFELCIGSIRDYARLAELFQKYKPDLVFHAAAHKHVPLMEDNPVEAVKNNVFGTKNLLTACENFGVKRVVQISTDKAVRPTNIMGATKRITELMVQAMNGRCEMVAVRFGNVLGSNGSVIPTFRKQIEQGGPVTVTDKNITRYFMTIPEAVSLVLCAGSSAAGGEIFVLDMGEPVRIYDLAVNMIELMGHVPGKDIQIKITGLRPGEKMYEELARSDENVDRTSNDKIFVMKAKPGELGTLNQSLEQLQQLLERGAGEEEMRMAVFNIIEGKLPADGQAPVSFEEKQFLATAK